MGSIIKRVYPSGTITYRVQLSSYKKGSFSLTFDDYEAACDWLDKHEERFKKDPNFYFQWRLELIKKYRREDVKVLNNILKPKDMSK